MHGECARLVVLIFAISCLARVTDASIRARTVTIHININSEGRINPR